MVNKNVCTVVPSVSDGIYCNHFRRAEIIAKDWQELTYYANVSDLVMHQLFHSLVANESAFFDALGTADELADAMIEYREAKNYYSGVIGKALFTYTTINKGKFNKSLEVLQRLVTENKRRTRVRSLDQLTKVERLTCSCVQFRGGANSTTWIGSLATVPYQKFSMLVDNDAYKTTCITIDEETRMRVARALRRASECNFQSLKELDCFIQYTFMTQKTRYAKDLFILVVAGNILALTDKVDTQDIISTAIYHAGLEFTGGRYAKG